MWHERHQPKLASRPRKRAVGAGAKHRLVFVDRLLATLVHLRHAVTHDVLACWFGVDRATVTRAIGEVRPLLAERGCTISPGVRLRTLAEIVDHLGTSGKTGLSISRSSISARCTLVRTATACGTCSPQANSAAAWTMRSGCCAGRLPAPVSDSR
ncbi:hypothetical protein GCM10010345_92240 [Streptomyces canarius]|uniref:Transposase Helix-turn-helix domain-containing protein n=1 Tax=Streptomyces canarius TaxID=285453 RepID=A0ABQ3DCY1_9ACTN|nr:hypothetical protein GCM10010345_92240 [Streptomyces canarius]